MSQRLLTSDNLSNSRRTLLWTEMLVLFVGIPLLHFFKLLPFHFIVTMVALSVIAVTYIYRHPKVSNKVFGLNGLNDWPYLWGLFALFAIGSTLFVCLTTPEQLFIMPRQEPLRWLAVMGFYPVFSGITQELLFRGFFMERYKHLFASPYMLIFVNGVLFGLAHLMFGHWLTVFLSTLGGFIYAGLYYRYKSILIASIVHGLIGNWIFTVGLGQYFYLKQ
jgi:membrane protease YdiL (CAAX protease family)